MVIRLYVSVFHNRGSLVSYYAGTYAHGTQYTAPFCNTSNLSAPLLPPVHFFQSKTTLYKIFCNSRSQFAVNNQLYGHGPSHFRWVWYASYTHWYEGYCNYRISHTMPAGGTDIIEINLRANCGHWLNMVFQFLRASFCIFVSWLLPIRGPRPITLYSDPCHY